MKRWTKIKALRYLLENKPKLEECITKSIDLVNGSMPANGDADPYTYSVMVASAILLSETDKGANLEKDDDLYQIAKELVEVI